MKLLFDQNLSFKLCRPLASLYPQSSQARLLGLDQVDDEELWAYARAHDFTIVTQDSDLPALCHLRGWPPKIVWLRCGNQPTRHIEHLLRVHHAAILQFENNPDAGVLEVA
jgi:predicted nuclease of predicted toxin-antitoxin system